MPQNRSSITRDHSYRCITSPVLISCSTQTAYLTKHFSQGTNTNGKVLSSRNEANRTGVVQRTPIIFSLSFALPSTQDIPAKLKPSPRYHPVRQTRELYKTHYMDNRHHASARRKHFERVETSYSAITGETMSK